MLQYWCSFRTVPAQGGGGHQLQYRGVQLQRLLQEEESYSWGDCFANYRNSYERRKRRCQEVSSTPEALAEGGPWERAGAARLDNY